jgi:hypothetical protein
MESQFSINKSYRQLSEISQDKQHVSPHVQNNWNLNTLTNSMLQILKCYSALASTNWFNICLQQGNFIMLHVLASFQWRLYEIPTPPLLPLTLKHKVAMSPLISFVFRFCNKPILSSTPQTINSSAMYFRCYKSTLMKW